MSLTLKLKTRKEWSGRSRTLILWYEIWDVTILVVICWWLLHIVCWKVSLENNVVFFHDLPDWSSLPPPPMPPLKWYKYIFFSFLPASLMRYSGYFGHIVTICLLALYLPPVLYICRGGDIMNDGHHNILHCPPVISQDD